MPRFVLLEHDHPSRHHDLMLESDGRLATWRLPHPLDLSRPVPAERIGDHRAAYLDYEGPVGGGRGQVRRVDAGALTWIRNEEGRVEVLLEGAILSGRWELLRHPDGSWLLRQLFE